MRLEIHAPNQTSVHLGQTEIFFSYEIPVAIDTGMEILVTEKKYSVTTSKHINQWLQGRKFRNVSQEEIELWGSENRPDPIAYFANC